VPAPRPEPKALGVAVPAARAVTVGQSHGCVVTQAGELWCFRDRFAEVAGLFPYSGVPGRIAIGERVVAATASGERTCALTATGGVVCLGDIEGLGQPYRVASIANATALSVAREHGCTVTRTARALCWGSADFGALGTPAGTPGEVPRVSDVVSVAAGLFGACAVRASGRLVCWGAASLIPWAPYRADAPGREVPVTPPTELAAPHDVVSVSLDGPCILRKSGHAHCWAPEGASTILTENPLRGDSLVHGLDDGVRLEGALVVRATGEVAAIDSAYGEGEPRYRAVPVTGLDAPAAQADGNGERGCAVDHAGKVACWGM
jgi:hypothetical protein